MNTPTVTVLVDRPHFEMDVVEIPLSFDSALCLKLALTVIDGYRSEVSQAILEKTGCCPESSSHTHYEFAVNEENDKLTVTVKHGHWKEEDGCGS